MSFRNMYFVKLLPIISVICILIKVVVCDSDKSESAGGISEAENYADKDYPDVLIDSDEEDIVERSLANVNKTLFTGCIKGTVRIKSNTYARSNDSNVNAIYDQTYEADTNAISEENETEPIPIEESIEHDLDDALKEILQKQPQFRERNTLRSGGTVDEFNSGSAGSSSEADFHIKSFPYTVCVHKRGSHVANGALLDKQWVLTAANEFINVRESIKMYNVRLGSTNCKDGRNFPIKLLEIHPSYRAGSPDFDLALIKMAYPVEFFEKVQPIKLSRKKDLSAITIIYWAKLHPVKTSKIFPLSANIGKGFLRYCRIDILSKDKCKSYMLKSNMRLIDSSRCIRPEDNENCKFWTNRGSSPLVTSDGLFGMTSPWLNNNLTETTPTVFTALSQPLVKNWIYHVMMSK